MSSNSLINRSILRTMSRLFDYFPVVTVTGPRQAGKTTLCRKLFAELPYVNLEDVSILQQAKMDPKGFLLANPEGMIIDEAQRFPEIFSYLQWIVDEDRMSGTTPHKYVVTGSANFQLLQSVSESMVGRTAVLTLLPLSLEEICSMGSLPSTDTTLLRGGYPAVWTSGDEGRALLLSNYYTTYVERDLRQLINIKDLTAFNHFIRLCAGRIGMECSASALSVETGVSVPTIQSWLSILEASYVIYRLHPYYANIGKRLTKTPKIYFYDTGLASWLLGINHPDQMFAHPQRGSLFENMVINDFLKHYYNKGEQPSLFFYRDQRQHEVDLLRVNPDGSMDAYEIKSGKTIRSDFFNGLHYLKHALGERLVSTTVIYDGEEENLAQEDAYCSYRNITSCINPRET